MSQVDAFCDALQLFKLGYSWAGPVSLVVPYHLASMRQMAQPGLLQGGFVRLAVGMESPEDLVADLSQALRVLSA